MNRDRRTRNPRACRPRQGPRRVGGGWAVDDRWAGIATVPRSAAADSLLEFIVVDAVEHEVAQEHTVSGRRASLCGDAGRSAEDAQEESV
ncbi:hypothetical protein ACL02S_22415 [Nocardia sp. 004]|uniref:hypothetical protein n=1 Tax=Nocardia sp. 004 TaxID=3385978 RepID=UPI0039A345E6